MCHESSPPVTSKGSGLSRNERFGLKNGGIFHGRDMKEARQDRFLFLNVGLFSSLSTCKTC